MTNTEIAELLREVAASYIVKEKNRFRIIAYERAADAIEHATSSVKDLWDDNKLETIPGVGKEIGSHLDELFRTGGVKHFREAKKGLPPGMFQILTVLGIGPKTAYRLAKELHITSVESLRKACLGGKIRSLAGFGEKSEEEFLKGIDEYEKRSRRILLPQAAYTADRIISYLRKNKSVIRADVLGSLRRQVSTVGDIDIAVATNDPKSVIESFCSVPGIERVLEKGEAKASVKLSDEKQVDLRVQELESYGALLQHFTGSKHHNIALREHAQKKEWSLSEYGVKVKGKLLKFATEEAFYAKLGMQYIPPELREAEGEIERALARTLPTLVNLKDIKGDLHIHSDFNIEPSHDLGRSSLKKILSVAKERGYEYIGLSEHNPSNSLHQDRQKIDLIKRRNEYIDHTISSIKSKTSIRVLKLLEIDILNYGELSIPEKALELLDGAIVSIHSSFRQSRMQMTKRVLQGLSHPKAKILAHPTGRLLLSREGFELDWDKVFEFCLKHNKILEINSWPTRLDLADVLVKDARDRGVKLIINTDSHDAEHMKLMRFGVSVARRGWCEKSDIVNCLPFDAFRAILTKN
ncbi:MAG TPA: DNA polymerase/3'-5' exonuclease PolX [Patescibacteria group bacterium]|nr:DNA polymerase/3'-5' exonuclease PolX [Patescibacteria group bacterium]